MAKLKIQAPLGKTLVVDVEDADPSEYDALAAAALEDYTSKMSPADRIAMQNLQDLDGKGPIDELMGAHEAVAKPIRAGISGVADLVSGNGLDQAAKDVKNVEDDKPAETTAGKVGSFVGGLASPAQIAIQAGLGPIAAELGPWVTDTLKGWSGEAAVAAVGKIKTLAKTLGVKNLDALGQFLLKPVTIGEQTFEPIVKATSSPADMLRAGQAIQRAAGAHLGAVAKAGDAAVSEAAEQGGVSFIADLPKLQQNIEALRASEVGDLPRLGKKIATQYDEFLGDLQDVVEEIKKGNTSGVFSRLARIKTQLGGLVYKHGSPLESKAALEDIYHVISEMLDTTAKNVGGETAEAYALANDVYHKAVSIVGGLEGKVVDAKNWFGGPGIVGAITSATALMTHDPKALLAVPAAYMATKIGANYAPQAIASGLDAAAPLIGSAMRGALRTLPVVGNAISSALNVNQ